MEKNSTNSRRTTISLEGRYLVITKGNKIRRYLLKEVTIGELREYLKNKVPIFVLKIGENFLLAEIEEKDNFNHANLRLFEEEKPFHICGDCSHCAGALPQNGGCLKVLEDKWLHNYQFVSLGIETCNVKRGASVNKVLKCDNYKKGRLELK